MKRYKLIQVGRHELPLCEINNDIPSPGELVAECERDLFIGIEIPPWSTPEECHQHVRSQMASALRAARKQGWKYVLVQ